MKNRRPNSLKRRFYNPDSDVLPVPGKSKRNQCALLLTIRVMKSGLRSPNVIDHDDV
jgi:hypothetical protein